MAAPTPTNDELFAMMEQQNLAIQGLVKAIQRIKGYENGVLNEVIVPLDEYENLKPSNPDI